VRPRVAPTCGLLHARAPTRIAPAPPLPRRSAHVSRHSWPRPLLLASCRIVKLSQLGNYMNMTSRVPLPTRFAHAFPTRFPLRSLLTSSIWRSTPESRAGVPVRGSLHLASSGLLSRRSVSRASGLSAVAGRLAVNSQAENRRGSSDPGGESGYMRTSRLVPPPIAFAEIEESETATASVK
jgi:hypothetical protein